MSEHWPDIARQWELVGPPLRPTSEDVGFFAAAVRSWELDRGHARRLILGVTPELYRMFSPRGDLLAVDHTPAMIGAIWRGPRSCVACADWTALPLTAGSRDVALCDGGFHLLPYPLGQARLVRSLHRVIAPGGLCAFRLFVPPGQREPVDVVLGDLLAGRVLSLNVLKLRLGMAMQADPTFGVRLADVWDAIHAAAPDPAALAARIGWNLEHLLAINTYRDCPRRYHFVTVAEACATFRAGGFELERVDFASSYDLCDRCPTVVFRRLP